MWDLGHKQGWALKNWCFQTVVLEKSENSGWKGYVFLPVLRFASLWEGFFIFFDCPGSLLLCTGFSGCGVGLVARFIGRQILPQWTTREVLMKGFFPKGIRVKSLVSLYLLTPLHTLMACIWDQELTSVFLKHLPLIYLRNRQPTANMCSQWR